MEQRIWLGIVESERYYRYYHGLAHKIRRQQLWSDVILLIAVSGVVATLVSHYLQGPSETTALILLTSIVGGIAGWQQYRGYAAKATAASLIANQYKSLGEDWRRQWHRGGGDDEIIVAILTERMTSIAGQHDLPYDEKVSIKAEEDADRQVMGEFPTAA